MSTTVLVALAVVTMLGANSAGKTDTERVVFELVAPTSPAPLSLLQGTAYLESVSDSTSTRTVALNTEHTLPPGEWAWQAEAPGWVSMGWNTVPSLGSAASKSAGPLRLRARAVPSCGLDFEADRRSHAVRRLWVVAVDAHTTYHHVLPRPLPLAVPEGRFYLAAFDHRGLLGLSGPHRCQPGESLRLPWPWQEAPDRHAFLVELVQPAGEVVAKLEELELHARPNRVRNQGELTAPEVLVWTGPRGVALFPALPAGELREWRLFHPHLRSERGDADFRGGGATALESFQLRRRATLTIPIDYQPARAHGKAVVVTDYCGRLGHLDPIYHDGAPCTRRREEHRLRPGLNEVTFTDLDTGLHVFHAEIDDETVFGLGNDFAPFLEHEADGFEPPAPQVLAEVHFWGHLLEDGEPVAGELRLSFQGTHQQELRFPTGGDLLYHAHFFGYLPWSEAALARLPNAASQQPGEPIRGLWNGWAILPCKASGACRSYRSGSSLVGGGRLDFELGRGVEIEVLVTDAASGALLAGVEVVAAGEKSGATSHFSEGQSVERQSSGYSFNGRVTDTEGRAALLLEPGTIEIWVVKSRSPPPWYQAQSQRVNLRPGESATLRFNLVPAQGLPSER